MKRAVFLFLTSLVLLPAQTRHSSSRFQPNMTPRPKSALVDPNDRVFPDIAAGGGWETIITFVNMSSSSSHFTLTFYDDDGNPLPMPLVNVDGSISRLSAADFALDGNTSSELVVANVDSA